MDPGPSQQVQGEPIADAEPFERLAGPAVDEDAIGQDAVHVENEQADRFEPLPDARGKVTWHGGMVDRTEGHVQPGVAVAGSGASGFGRGGILDARWSIRVPNARRAT